MSVHTFFPGALGYLNCFSFSNCYGSLRASKWYFSNYYGLLRVVFFFYFWFYGLSTVESLIANAPLGWNVLVLFYCVISEIM